MHRMLRLGDRRQSPVGGEPVEFVDAALQQVRPLDGQALGVVRAEDAGDSRREDLVRQFRLLLGARRGEPRVAQVEFGADGGESAPLVDVHHRAEQAIGVGGVPQRVFAQPLQQLLPSERYGDEVSHGGAAAQRIHGVGVAFFVAFAAGGRSGVIRLTRIAGVGVLDFLRGVPYEVFEIDVLHHVGEALQRLQIIIPDGRRNGLTGGIRLRVLGASGIRLRGAGIRRRLRGRRMRRIAVMVAVLRIGLGRAGIARVQALERSQRCAHQIGDRAVLLGDRLFQTDGIDAHAHLIDPFARAEAQCRDDEPDAEIVRGAHGGPFPLRERDPIVGALVIAAFRHHGGARRGERHRGRPLFEIAAEFHVEAIREPQLAQQPGHRLTVHPF